MLVDRENFINAIKDGLTLYPICALLGPRQCGKTTLAHQYIKTINEKVFFFDLEDPLHLDQLSQPKTTLDPLSGLIVIDEIQRLPNLFPYLRVLADYSDKKFLILGSASGKLLRQSSESLTGRIEYLELTPFTLEETKNFERLWLYGGFPKSYLSKSYKESLRWRQNYIRGFIERDLPLLEIDLNPIAMRRLWMILSHYHGQLLNYSDMGRTLGVSDMTIRRYLEILSQTFMIRLLQPWHENISKRQVKTPKVYIRDSGMFHGLLNIQEEEWYIHPKKGVSFEGFALEELIRTFGMEGECFFWRTQTGAELDLLLLKNGKKYGFEIKLADAPEITKSMYVALEDLKLDHLYIITPSDRTYSKTDKITVAGIKALPILA